MRRLFAEVLGHADAAQQGTARRSVLRPGPFWLLARADPPVEQIHAYWGGAMPVGWPPWFERNQRALIDDPLRDALDFCLRSAPDAGISSGRDLCRLIGAVAQTLYSTNLDLVRRNRALMPATTLPPTPARATVAAWQDEGKFLAQRPDEHGGSLTRGQIALWMGSHVGPSYADKVENQDAVCAFECGAGLVFALADGVSTSLGSRHAAALAVHRFCSEAARLYQCSGTDEAVLVEAAHYTQRGLDDVLEDILADPSAPVPEFLKSSMAEKTAFAVLGNTKTGEKDFLQPALATTLIGGFLQPGPDGREFHCTVLCVGDGAVERIGQDGAAFPLIATDPGKTEIGGFIGAGVRSRRMLEREGVTVGHQVLRAGEHLLISSDGLARGHTNTVWDEIVELTGDPRSRLERGNDAIAVGLLRDVAGAADARHEAGGLLDDNLSLIVVAVG
jgi:hypothetical protein